MAIPSAADDALEQVHRHHLEYGPGFSDHAPMVVEALEHAGRSDAIEAWVRGYVGRLDPVDAADRGEERTWIERFEAEIDEVGWRGVLASWVPRLASAVPTAAGHGTLRTAHAVRSLARADTPVRRAELARGLAYWSWRRLDLPTVPLAGLRPPEAVLGSVTPLLDPDPDAMISSRLRHVVTDELVRTVAATELSSDPSEALETVTRAASTALRSAGADGTFAVLHGLTSAIAVRDLLPFAASERAEELVAVTWTTVVALWAGYGEGRPLVGAAPASAPPAGELVDRAVTHGDEHAIKVAVAAWSEERATGGDRPDLRAAALVGLEFFGA